MKYSKLFPMVLLLLCSLWVSAAGVPEVTKKYKNTPLVEVLRSLEKKTKYTIVFDPAELDETRLVNGTFKQMRLTSVVKRVVGKEYDVKANTKSQTLTIVKKQMASVQEAQPISEIRSEAPLQTVTTTIVANESQQGQNIDSIRQTVKMQLVSHKDSTMQVSQRQVKQAAKNQPEPKYLHCSHRVIAGVGIGYGEVIKNGNIAALGDVNYAYFFNDNWGVSLGLGVDYYPSRYAYNEDFVEKRYTDTDKEPETDLRVSYRNMLEQHNLLTVNIPLQLQMEYHMPSQGTPLWLYGSVGPRIGYPVIHSYQLTGECYKEGYYEKWNLILQDMHEYGTTAIDKKAEFPVKTPTIAPHVELGVAIGVKENLAIGVGAYGNVSVLNEQDYLPWQVGAKVSVRWRKNVKPQPLPTVYETIMVSDTVWTYKEIVDTIRTVEYDTIMHPAAQAIAKVMERSIIWFDLDKTIPKLDPVDMLDEIAEILINNPDQQIEVNGHTCDLGKKAYNEKLSLRRAEAVVKLLVEKGVRPEQMVVHAYANSLPYYSKSHDRYLDRRVEIVPIIDK